MSLMIISAARSCDKKNNHNDAILKNRFEALHFRVEESTLEHLLVKSAICSIMDIVRALKNEIRDYAGNLSIYDVGRCGIAPNKLHKQS